MMGIQIAWSWNESLINFLSGIYLFVSSIYEFLTQELLAGKLLNIPEIEAFTSRLYIIIGIFILFRVTYTFLMMLVDPDKVSDKKEGLGNIVTRLITVIIMTIAAPLVFQFMMNLQTAVISQSSKEESSFFERFFLVDTQTFSNSLLKTNQDKYLGDTTTNVKQQSTGDSITCYYGLFQMVAPQGEGDKWNYTVYGEVATKITEDSNGAYIIKNGDIKVPSNSGITIPDPLELDDKGRKITSLQCPGSIEFKSNSIKLYTEEFTLINAAFVAQYGNTNQDVTIKGVSQSLYSSSGTCLASGDYCNLLTENQTGIDSTKPGIQFATSIMSAFQNCSGSAADAEGNCTAEVKEKQNNIFTAPSKIADLADKKLLDLGFFPAVIGGIILMGYLIVLCIDVVVRQFKLLLLQMIAPIPIATYLEPSSKVFGAFTKSYMATYVELFLKLGAIYLLVYFLKLPLITGSTGLVRLLYIFGLLIFAKAVPDFIGNIFGLKDLGKGFTMNPLKRLSEAALIGGAVGGVVGGAVGLATTGSAAGAWAGAKKGFSNSGGLKGNDGKTPMLKDLRTTALKGRDQSVGQFKKLNDISSKADEAKGKYDSAKEAHKNATTNRAQMEQLRNDSNLEFSNLRDRYRSLGSQETAIQTRLGQIESDRTRRRITTANPAADYTDAEKTEIVTLQNSASSVAQEKTRIVTERGRLDAKVRDLDTRIAAADADIAAKDIVKKNAEQIKDQTAAEKETQTLRTKGTTSSNEYKANRRG